MNLWFYLKIYTQNFISITHNGENMSSALFGTGSYNQVSRTGTQKIQMFHSQSGFRIPVWSVLGRNPSLTSSCIFSRQRAERERESCLHALFMAPEKALFLVKSAPPLWPMRGNEWKVKSMQREINSAKEQTRILLSSKKEVMVLRDSLMAVAGMIMRNRVVFPQEQRQAHRQWASWATFPILKVGEIMACMNKLWGSVRRLRCQ